MTTFAIDYRTPPSSSAVREPILAIVLLVVPVLLALAQVAVSALIFAGAIHYTRAANLDLNGWLRFLLTVLHAGVAALLLYLAWMAIFSVMRRTDSAPPIIRLLSATFYISLISTAATWPLFRNPSYDWTTDVVWITRLLVINAPPVIALLFFLLSSHVAGSLNPQFRAQANDAALKTFSGDSAIGVLLMLASLVAVLAYAAVPSVRTFGAHFLVSSEWRPNALPGEPTKDAQGHVVIEDGEIVRGPDLPPAFGALPVIYGTAVSAVLSLFIAVPLAFGASIFLVRVAKPFIAGPVSFLIEFLAAIPSIAYGLWGLFVMCPFLQAHVEPKLNSFLSGTPGLGWLASPTGAITGRDMLAGGLILGVMIIPIITAISRDVLRQVPRAQVEGTVALGATWWESSKEMLKYSRSGLFGAIMLGLARAAGETMAITMVIGNNNQIKASILAPAQTMSSLLANEFAEASTDVHRAALTEVALILLLMSLGFNVVARYLVVGKHARTSAAH